MGEGQGYGVTWGRAAGLPTQGGHWSLEGLLTWASGGGQGGAESFLHPPCPKFLQLQVFNMPKRHILGRRVRILSLCANIVCPCVNGAGKKADSRNRIRQGQKASRPGSSRTLEKMRAYH